MTPEERVAAAFERIRATNSHAIDDSYGIATRELAAAIREAVDAETEACAARAEWFSYALAHELRQRAASRAQPAP